MFDPVTYSKHNLDTEKQAYKLLQQNTDFFKWKDSEEILEIGCADGRNTCQILYPFIKNHISQLTGVDCSSEAIEVAKKWNSNSKITFRVMNIEDEVKDSDWNRFGHIFSFLCLHFVRSSEKWIRNIGNLLKPNGQFVATIILKPNIVSNALREQRNCSESVWFEALNKVPDGLADYGDNPIEYVSEILEEFGFRVDKAEITSERNTFQDFEYIKKMLLTVNYALKHIPLEHRSLYEENYIQMTFRDISRDENGKYYYEVKVLNLFATKLRQT